MEALNKIPPIVLFGAGALMLSYAAQQTANGVSTAGTGVLKLVGAGVLGRLAWVLLA